MPEDVVRELLMLLLLLLLSGLFAGSETALLSISLARAKALNHEGRRGAAALYRLKGTSNFSRCPYPSSELPLGDATQPRMHEFSAPHSEIRSRDLQLSLFVDHVMLIGQPNTRWNGALVALHQTATYPALLSHIRVDLAQVITVGRKSQDIHMNCG